jgi:hypothetical protein
MKENETIEKKGCARPPNLFVLIFKFLISRALGGLQGAIDKAK